MKNEWMREDYVVLTGPFIHFSASYGHYFLSISLQDSYFSSVLMRNYCIIHVLLEYLSLSLQTVNFEIQAFSLMAAPNTETAKTTKLLLVTSPPPPTTIIPTSTTSTTTRDNLTIKENRNETIEVSSSLAAFPLVTNSPDKTAANNATTAATVNHHHWDESADSHESMEFLEIVNDDKLVKGEKVIEIKTPWNTHLGDDDAEATE